MEVYTKTDQCLHLLSQLIAKVNKAFVPKKADDNHTTLYFDPLTKKIGGRWITTDRGDIMLCLDLDQQAFNWQNRSLRGRFLRYRSCILWIGVNELGR